MYYLQQNSDRRWLRHGLSAAMLLSALAALGSYSRGALLAIAAMVLFMWLKSGRKLVLGALLGLVTPLLLAFMPERWAERMDTINTYQDDVSAMGRLNAWHMAYNLACDRFFGGGYEVAEASIFLMYAPNPTAIHAAHSIYFQALGEHGFVGLLIYLAMYFVVWRSGTWVINNAGRLPELEWATRLVRMLQVSIVGFLVGGAFLSLAYFDVPYYIMVIMVATRLLV
ncbi:MAG: putative O-glycosylation ligase, exosortase A system-associated, partial [Janthinobacterium sp.]